MALWSLTDEMPDWQKTLLYEAIPARHSVRDFMSAPSTERWNDIIAACERLSRNGVRLVPAICEPSLFQPFFGLMKGIKGAKRYVAIITEGGKPSEAFEAGARGELLALYAVHLGLGGVWVSGTYRKALVNPLLKPGERLLGAIALGMPHEGDEYPRKRRPIERLCLNDFAGAPLPFREVLSAVRIAPSAINLQPWRFRLEGERSMSISVHKSFSQLDFGIAAAHAALALGVTDARLSLDDSCKSLLIELAN